MKANDKHQTEELSLLVYSATINNKSLPKVMSKWTGCPEEEYTDSLQVSLYQTTIIDITRGYHIPNLMYQYFESKRITSFCDWSDDWSENKKELEALKGALRWIPVKMWSDEDRDMLIKLKKEYIDEIEND